MTIPENPASLPGQDRANDQERNTGAGIISYPITSVEPGDLKECSFTEAEVTYLTTYLPEIARKMADVYLGTRFWDDLRFFARSILDQIKPSISQAVDYYLGEIAIYIPEDAQKILDASCSSPWFDQGINNAQGHGYVLPVQYLDMLPEGIVIPPEINGRRTVGLFIDGTLSLEVIQQFRDILGEARVWRAWPDSDFAVVAPDSNYTNPMDDPLLAHLALATPLEEAFHTLADLKRTFIALYEGYLIVQNEQGQFETWPMLPDGRGIDQDLSELLPVVKYQGDLYSYGNTYPTKEEVYLAIQREIEK